MNIIVVDISGKVDNYCTFLCEALDREIGDKGTVTFFNTREVDNLNCNFVKLINLVPKKYWYSKKKWKRYIKAIEGILNYFLLGAYLLFHKVDIVHLQWFPFLEFCTIESFFLKFISGKNRSIVYTHHNLYPHGTDENGKIIYRNRFDKVKKYIDAYIVHTNNDKESLQAEFCIPDTSIFIACHGVFEPREAVYKPVIRNDGLTRFLMFGVQTGYKGTDIFIEAIKLIPQDLRCQMSFQIVGATDELLYKKYKELADSLNIDWIPISVSYGQLHTIINESDVVVFPYRAISQSGALLLAIFFEKRIIPSNLLTFKETLVGFDPSWFCEKDDPNSLSRMMIKHLDSKQFDKEKDVVRALKDRYSWESAAKSTVECYLQSTKRVRT